MKDGDDQVAFERLMNATYLRERRRQCDRERRTNRWKHGLAGGSAFLLILGDVLKAGPGLSFLLMLQFIVCLCVCTRFDFEADDNDPAGGRWSGSAPLALGIAVIAVRLWF